MGKIGLYIFFLPNDFRGGKYRTAAKCVGFVRHILSESKVDKNRVAFFIDENILRLNVPKLRETTKTIARG